MTDDNLKRRIEKFRTNESHFKYLMKKGYSSIEIMDKIIHELLVILKEGLKSKYTELTEKDILKKMREISENELKLKSFHKDLKNNGI